MTAKNHIRAVIEDAITMAATNALPLGELRGIALYDTLRDDRIASVPSFEIATQAVTLIPNFETHFGNQTSSRAVLQFVYQYFARVDTLRYEQDTFDGLWTDFTAEIEDPRWVTRGVANVRNFTSDKLFLELDDGVLIRGRSTNDLASMGIGPAILEKLTEDWRFGVSSFVLVTEHAVQKAPEYIVTLGTAEVWEKATRAVKALRLVDAGSISIGPMWVIRAARFNFGIGGLHQYGISIPNIGPEFVWSDDVEKMFPGIYAALQKLELGGYGRSPGNLDVALQAFAATYDRWPLRPDSQLLDSITALEALLGTETEISFKLAFRVASLVADSDKERAEMLGLMKAFYDTRSTIVHGGALKEKHRLRLAKVDELRSIIRRLLKSFVAFAAAPTGMYTKSFFREQLDAALVNATERETLRTTLRLNRQ